MIFINYFTVVVFSISFNTRSFNTTRFKYGLAYRWLSFCAIRGIAYAKTQMGAAQNMRYFHIGVLCFAFAEYLLWTVGCFWPDTSLASPAFWCDMLLTFAILGLLPATRKAVDA